MRQQKYFEKNFQRDVNRQKVFSTVFVLGCLLGFGAGLVAGCGKPGGSDSNVTNVIVTVISVNGNAVLKSDILTDGYPVDDIIEVELMSQPRDLGNDDPYFYHPTDYDNVSSFDTVVFHSYHVTHVRSDSGPNPPDFTMGINLTLQPTRLINVDDDEDDDDDELDHQADIDPDTTTTEIIVTRALDKGLSPLKELRDRGQIATTATITFYGEDGYGNDITVSASLIISFANYPEE